MQKKPKAEKTLAVITDDEYLEQEKLFDGLGLSRDTFKVDKFYFTSKFTRPYIKDHAFASLEELNQKIVMPMNKELSSDFMIAWKTDKYIYLRCLTKGCKFAHGFTYTAKPDNSATDIKSSPKVG